jgi:hypothetical protein
VLNTALLVLLGHRFFRPDVLADRPVLRLGIRYGVLAVVLSFAVGGVMIANAGRSVGDEGSLLLVHGLGVHAIQAMPLVALALDGAGSPDRQRPWVHAAGIAWLAACLAALGQAVLGHRPLGPSVLTALVLAGLAVWAVVGIHALFVVRGDPPRRPVSTTSREPSLVEDR